MIDFKPTFKTERDAIKHAKNFLGTGAKKGLAFTTYMNGKKWGWINCSEPWKEKPNEPK